MSIQPRYIPLYFAPDQDPSWVKNPGVCVDVRNMVPTVKGTLTNYVCSSAENISAIAPFNMTGYGTPLSAQVLKRVSNASGNAARLFVGTNTDLLEMGASTFSSVSSSAHAYSSASRWTFAAFGDKMFATTGYPAQQPAYYPQFSQGDAGTAFASLTGTPNNPPKAALCVVQQNFLVLFNVYDGTSWTADGWSCSGLGNTASWTTLSGGANLTTQANNGRLIATPGPITNAVNQRDTIVVYKADSMYVMEYRGNPYTWSSRLISDQVGQVFQGGVIVVNGVHYFIHRTGVYAFDGSYPKNIGIGWVNSYLSHKIYGINANYLLGYGSLTGVHDEDNNLIIWYFYTSEEGGYSSGSADAGLAYNYVNGRWGWIDRAWDELTATTTDIAFCCPIQATRTDLALAGFSTTDSLGPLTVGMLGGSMYMRRIVIGDNSSSTQSTCAVFTGDMGDEFGYTRMLRIKPHLNAGDDNLQASTCYVDGKLSQGDFYGNEGFLMTATATSTSPGYAMFPLVSYSANYRRTVLVSDYIAFDMLQLSGSLGTKFGVSFWYSDSSIRYYTQVVAAFGVWTTYLVQLTAGDIGKSLSSISAMFDTAGATGVHQALVRRIRITDSSGNLRLRLFTGKETRIVNVVPNVINYSTATGFGCGSLGTQFTFDSTKRRYDGSVSNRWLRAKMTFYNKTDLAGVYVTTEPAGAE